MCPTEIRATKGEKNRKEMPKKYIENIEYPKFFNCNVVHKAIRVIENTTWKTSAYRVSNNGKNKASGEKISIPIEKIRFPKMPTVLLAFENWSTSAT